MQEATGRVIVAVSNRSDLDAALDEAVDLLKPKALTEQVGLSVTRLVPGRYEVCVNRDVPMGVTIEM
jgi:hypothetical protein